MRPVYCNIGTCQTHGNDDSTTKGWLFKAAKDYGSCDAGFRSERRSILAKNLRTNSILIALGILVALFSRAF